MRIVHLVATAILVVVCFVCLQSSPTSAETRIALVIGNGAYQNVSRLPNPANDAKAVAAALRRSGFDTIIATDLDKQGMEDATIRFARAARDADIALFYYSGHALQFNGVNYLAPTDAKLADESDLRRMTRVDEIVSDLQQAKSLRILVLDSCRDNPLAEQLRRSIGTTRSLPIGRGLAKIDTPQGMIMAYATQAGRTAEDGDGNNSPYTSAFLKRIEEQNEIGTIFREVSEDVYEATKHAQLPELSLSIIGRFYLRGMKAEPAAATDPKPTAPMKTTSSDFDAAVGVDTVAGWEAFLKEHSEGFYADLARERRANLEKRTKVGNQGKELASVLPTEKPDQSPSAVDVPKVLQVELRRVGCNTGGVDGNWNAASRTAMELFNKHAGMRLEVKVASTNALDVVKSKVGRVCPLLCEQGFVASGDRCVETSCDAGSFMNDRNECEKRREKPSRQQQEVKPKPSAPPKTSVAQTPPREPGSGSPGQCNVYGQCIDICHSRGGTGNGCSKYCSRYTRC
jgi:hypothetical protein